MSYLLAAGCSWTDANFTSHVDSTIDCSFPKWPEALAKQLGISEVVNIGISGGSNDYMFDRCYDKIIAQKPKMVCILLSGWDRHTIFNYISNLSTDLTVYEMKKQKNFAADWPWLEKYYKANEPMVNMSHNLWTDWLSVENVVDKTLRNIFLFQSFCEQHHIDYILMQGINQLAYPLGSKYFNNPHKTALEDIRCFIKYTLNSQYTSKINEKNILGWPFFWQIGGYSVHDKLLEKDISKFMIHPIDEHPNGLGHQEIADMFYKGYQDIYGKKS